MFAQGYILSWPRLYYTTYNHSPPPPFRLLVAHFKKQKISSLHRAMGTHPTIERRGAQKTKRPQRHETGHALLRRAARGLEAHMALASLRPERHTLTKITFNTPKHKKKRKHAHFVPILGGNVIPTTAYTLRHVAAYMRPRERAQFPPPHPYPRSFYLLSSLVICKCRKKSVGEGPISIDRFI